MKIEYPNDRPSHVPAASLKVGDCCLWGALTLMRTDSDSPGPQPNRHLSFLDLGSGREMIVGDTVPVRPIEISAVARFKN